METKFERLGFSAHVNGYDIFVCEDKVKISDGEGIVAEETVDGISEFIEKAENLKVGWGKLPDFEVVYIYDKADDNFGYAVNIPNSMLSEWGYAPF